MTRNPARCATAIGSSASAAPRRCIRRKWGRRRLGSTLTPPGAAKVQTAAHEIGTGAYTVIAMTAAERLGLALDKVDRRAWRHRIAASTGRRRVQHHRERLQRRRKGLRGDQGEDCQRGELVGGFKAPGGEDPKTLTFSQGRLVGLDGTGEDLETAMRRVANGAIEAYAENMPHGAKPDAIEQALPRDPKCSPAGPSSKDRIQFAFGAEFVELRVHRLTREIRCPRVVGAFAAGRIVERQDGDEPADGRIDLGRLLGLARSERKSTVARPASTTPTLPNT